MQDMTVLVCRVVCFFFFFFNDTATTEIYTLSLHDALPISSLWPARAWQTRRLPLSRQNRSEEHTSELQSRFGISYAVFCLKKKKKQKYNNTSTSVGPRLATASAAPTR